MCSNTDTLGGNNQGKSGCALTRYESFQSIFPVVVSSSKVDIKYGSTVPINYIDHNNYQCMLHVR